MTAYDLEWAEKALAKHRLLASTRVNVLWQIGYKPPKWHDTSAVVALYDIPPGYEGGTATAWLADGEEEGHTGEFRRIFFDENGPFIWAMPGTLEENYAAWRRGDHIN